MIKDLSKEVVFVNINGLVLLCTPHNPWTHGLDGVSEVLKHSKVNFDVKDKRENR